MPPSKQPKTLLYLSQTAFSSWYSLALFRCVRLEAGQLPYQEKKIRIFKAAVAKHCLLIIGFVLLLSTIHSTNHRAAVYYQLFFCNKIVISDKT